MYNKNGYIYTESGTCIAKLVGHSSHSDFVKYNNGTIPEVFDTKGTYFVTDAELTDVTDDSYEYLSGGLHSHTPQWTPLPTSDEWKMTSEESYETEYNTHTLNHWLTYPNCLGRADNGKVTDTGFSLHTWMMIQHSTDYNMYSYDDTTNTIKYTYEVTVGTDNTVVLRKAK